MANLDKKYKNFDKIMDVNMQSLTQMQPLSPSELAQMSDEESCLFSQVNEHSA